MFRYLVSSFIVAYVLSGLPDSYFAKITPELQHKYLTSLKLYNEGNYVAAMNESKEIISYDPRFCLAYKNLVRASNQARKLDELDSFFVSLHEKYPGNQYVEYGMALSAIAKGQLDQALISLKNSIAMDAKFEDPYISVVDVYKSKGNLDEAVSFLKDLMKKNRRNPNVYLGLGYYYKLKGENDYALKSLERSIELNSKGLNAPNIRAQLALSMLPNKAFLLACQHVDKLATEHHDFELLLKNYIRLSDAYSLFKDRLKVLEYLAKALEMADQIQEKNHRSAILMKLGILYKMWNKPAEAIKYLEEALKTSRQINDKVQESRCLYRLGDTYLGLERYAKAKESYIESLKLCNGKTDEGVNRMALIYIQLGILESIFCEYTKAIDLYKKASPLVKNHATEEYLLLQVGQAYNSQGKYALALHQFRRALKIAEQQRKNTKAGQLNELLGGIGVAYLGTGDLNLALEYLGQALEAAKKKNDIYQMGHWAEQIGGVNVRLGRHREAQKFYAMTLKIGQQITNLRIICRAYMGLGSVLESETKYEAALDYYKKADVVLEDVSKSSAWLEEKPTFIKEKTEIYEKLVNLLIKMDKGDPTQNLYEAFGYAQRAKAQSSMGLIKEGQVLKNLQEIPSGLRRKILESQQTLNFTRRALADKRAQRIELSPADKKGQKILDVLKEEMAELENKVDKLEKERSGLVTQIRENFPNYAKFAEPDYLTAEQIQNEYLGENEVLIEYLVGSEKTVAFIISKNKINYEQFPIGSGDPVDVADKKPENLKELMASISPIFDRSTEVRDQSQTVRWANIQLAKLHKLHNTIFKPLQKHLKPSDELIIVPDDLLSYLPFEILLAEFDTQRIKYLIEQYPISYVYSSNLLNRKLNPNLHKDRRDLPLNLLAIGNPDFGNYKDDKLDWVGRSVLAPQLSTPRGINSFSELPFAEIEVNTISKIIGDSKIFVGNAATESNFKNNANQARIIHLATHNEIDPLNYSYSRILFSLNPKINQKGEDGSLYTYEIFNLRLNSDLIVLNGCETGVGRLKYKEGLEGVSRAFMYAGAPSLIASLWPIVDGQASVRLSEKFYKNLVEGMDKRQALQKAKIDLISDSKYDDPFYWAPSILIGNTAPINLKKSSGFNSWLLFGSLLVFSGLFFCFVIYKVTTQASIKSMMAIIRNNYSSQISKLATFISHRSH